jgi:sugar lactone lactonase YvrE
MNATSRIDIRANRYSEGTEVTPRPTPGWYVDRVSTPSGLYGANGVTIGPDSRLYVAQFLANRITSIDPVDGSYETIVPFGSEVAAPDDTAFDSRGTMYITDTMPGRVWARDPDGELRVIADDLPSANGIACHDDRVFVNENREGGRLLEVFPDGSDPRVILDGLPHPNAMAVGPDGLLYFPLIIGEIWRVDIDDPATAERVLDGLVAPPALKFDSSGRLVTLSAITGEVLTFDLPSGEKTVVTRLPAGLDNVACGSDGRLFTSHFISGQITEVHRDGSHRVLNPPGFIGPAGIAVGRDGSVVVADLLGLIRAETDGSLTTLATLLDPGFPGIVRGLAVGPDGLFYMTTSAGSVVTYDPSAGASEVLSEGHVELMEIAVADDGTVVVAEAGGGRAVRIHRGQEAQTLADGLGRPTGVALDRAGRCFISDEETGRLVQIDSSGVSKVGQVDSPQGIVAVGNTVFVADSGAKQLVAITPGRDETTVLCDALPIGDPPGTAHTPVCGNALVPGPLTGMTGLTADGSGALYISATGEGSIIKIEREPTVGPDAR